MKDGRENVPADAIKAIEDFVSDLKSTPNINVETFHKKLEQLPPELLEHLGTVVQILRENMSTTLDQKEGTEKDTDYDQVVEPTFDVNEPYDRVPTLPAKVVSSCSMPNSYKTYPNNTRANRYLKHQFSRLDKCVKVLRVPLKNDSSMDLIMEYRKMSKYYGTIAKILLSRSDAYMMYGFNKALKGGGRMYDYREVIRVLYKLRRKLYTFNPKILMSRVYIPKADGIRYRPLGVPDKADRVLATMIAELLSRSLPRSPRQHLFLPRRGLHTAGRGIISNLKKFDNIYEYDLKGFFNSLYLEGVSHIMKSKFQMPGGIIAWLHHANHNLFGKLQAPKGLDVSEDVDLRQFNQASKDNAISNLSQVYEPILKQNKLRVVKKHMSKLLGDKPTLDYEDAMKMRKRGMPQGVAGSPILCTSVLPYSGIFNIPGIAAADDGLGCGNGKSLEDPRSFVSTGGRGPGLDRTPDNLTRYTGIEFADKAGSCQYIRKDGEWLVESLTFLGSTWDFTTNMLSNSNCPEGIPIFGIDDGELKKVLGKTYANSDTMFDRLTDTVNVHHDSGMTYRKDYRVFPKPEDFDSSLGYRMLDSQGLTYFSILADKSSICVEELFEYLSQVRLARTKKLHRLLPVEGLELSLHISEHGSEKDLRGRNPRGNRRGRKLGSKDQLPRTRRTQAVLGKSGYSRKKKSNSTE